MNEQTKTIIERFDHAFRSHEPSELTDIIADDCVLETPVLHRMVLHTKDMTLA